MIKQVKFLCAAMAALLMAGAAAAQTPAPAEPKDPSDPAGMTLPAPLKPIAEDQENLLNLDLSTGGRVTIQLRPDVAPLHIERIKTLVRQGFYNGVIFHRVIDGFMAQTGDPKGTGEGGSNLPDLVQEFNLLPHLRGAVSMARTNDPNSANSQFFIMFMPRPSLDRKYTVFGRVVSGMQFVDTIERGEPSDNPSKVLKAWLQTDGENAALLPAAPPAPVAAPAPAPVSAPETATPQ